VEAAPFDPLPRASLAALHRAIASYGYFLGVPVRLR
jgi:hypothetical protein